MRVEAVRKEGGFFIPINDELKAVAHDRIFLDMEIVRPVREEWPDFFNRAVSIFGKPSGKKASECVAENRKERS
ncbi:hypothetical protein [Desulfonema magnum]|uniref:Uncharacterized protein n=1 Tax=Desulfonema magnum TaxID=45655 RepID=A0A975BIU4_9BACT|nr:hypothetical protein [Desulfonema magnum]QTA86147.1 Uncharacterized protein dnm_021680 [Desulfonema magnum]